MRVVTLRVRSHAWLVRPRNNSNHARSIEWDKFANTHSAPYYPTVDRGLAYTQPPRKKNYHCGVCSGATEIAGQENAGLEIDGQKLQGVENDGHSIKG